MTLETSLGSLDVVGDIKFLNEEKNAIFVMQNRFPGEKYLCYVEDFDENSLTLLMILIMEYELTRIRNGEWTYEEAFLSCKSGVILELNIFNDGEQVWDIISPYHIKPERLPT